MFCPGNTFVLWLESGIANTIPLNDFGARDLEKPKKAACVLSGLLGLNRMYIVFSPYRYKCYNVEHRNGQHSSLF
jgi:hypothetical protein